MKKKVILIILVVFSLLTINIILAETSQIINPDEKTLQISQVQLKSSGKTYYFLPLLITLIILYSITYILSKKNKIKIITHRKIWNFFLLITFLFSGISGILLVLKANYGFPIFSKMLFMHVETGIAMAIISFYHILWHWPYFKNMIKFKSKTI